MRGNRIQDEVKNSPEHDKDKHADDPVHRNQVGGYYGGTAR